jgi:hypothetical protein
MNNTLKSLLDTTTSPVQQEWLKELYNRIDYDDSYDIANLIAAHEKFAKWLVEVRFKPENKSDLKLLNDARNDWPKKNDPFIHPNENETKYPRP